MSENCGRNCGACSADCGERQATAPHLHELSRVKKVVGVVSGKGGVGKSMVTSLLAVLFQRRGLRTAILDADITGPSIPRAFGIIDGAAGNELGLFPVESKTGISVMSLNLLVEDETEPVVWRGPVIANMAQQFWTEVIWKDIDIMLVDMPPGTGDVPLTIYQTLPLAGVVVVTSPQQLVGMIVEKAVNMANMLNIPILGLVENMSYVVCPDCGKRIEIFGESHAEDLAQKYGAKAFARLPLLREMASAADKGLIELADTNALEGIADGIEGYE